MKWTEYKERDIHTIYWNWNEKHKRASIYHIFIWYYIICWVFFGFVCSMCASFHFQLISVCYSHNIWFNYKSCKQHQQQMMQTSLWSIQIHTGRMYTEMVTISSTLTSNVAKNIKHILYELKWCIICINWILIGNGVKQSVLFWMKNGTMNSKNSQRKYAIFIHIKRPF